MNAEAPSEKNPQCIGLSNTVPDGTSVAYSTVIGRKTFGRVADLLCAWANREHQVAESSVAGIRVLISALLESLPEGNLSPTRIEMAILGDQALVAVRTECGIVVDAGGVERAFTQHWLNSNEMQILRRVMDPRDRIEVRFQPKTRLVEWRVVRSLAGLEIDPSVSSFVVHEDLRAGLEEPATSYRDLGDLPFDEWLDEAYRSSRGATGGGEIRIQGNALQSDADHVRIKVGQELDELEKRAVRGEDSEEPESGLRMIENLLQQLRKKEASAEELEQMVLQLQEESRARRKDLTVWKKRYQQVVELLNRKEMALYTQTNELRFLEKSQLGSTGANPFKEKALQMFEKLKATAEQNEALKKEMQALRERESNPLAVGSGGFESGTTIRTNTEDLEKKLDRVQRALDAEKVKTSSLLERALNAEKEAQSSAPMISDLEAKVEHTLKTSMQYKKEIDSMKQKLVQSDAEKNKIKNELLKAQAQIQTLMKRQAS